METLKVQYLSICCIKDLLYHNGYIKLLSVVALKGNYCDLDGDSEKAQFLQKLAKLRKQSSVFLRMLNDMRRRLKELPPDATAAKSYK